MLSESEYSEVSAEEKIIAGVLLAGWHIDDWTDGLGKGILNRYRLWSPQGRIMGHYATKYVAALAAIRRLEDA
jgi:hypothetical protein